MMALSRNEIKLIKSLQNKKEREEQRLFVAEGAKLCEELMTAPNFRIDRIFYTEAAEPFSDGKTEWIKISASDMERISGLVNPPGILAVVHFPNSSRDQSATDENFMLALDDIKDPGNLGTILRTADWFGIKTVYASLNSVDLFNPKVIQASMGAVFRVHYLTTDLNTELNKLKSLGYKILGADMKGESLYSFRFPQKSVLVMGSESHGLSKEVSSLLDSRITIPSFGQTESLNVGVAAAIIISHVKNSSAE
jgi:TrmH family RNA methyltransferase